MNKFTNDIITIIFEFDNTYKIKFQEVIAELKRLYNFYLKQANIFLEIDVGIGKSDAMVYTCDLTHKYIDINADYRS